MADRATLRKLREKVHEAWELLQDHEQTSGTPEEMRRIGAALQADYDQAMQAYLAELLRG